MEKSFFVWMILIHSETTVCRITLIPSYWISMTIKCLNSTVMALMLIIFWDQRGSEENYWILSLYENSSHFIILKDTMNSLVTYCQHYIYWITNGYILVLWKPNWNTGFKRFGTISLLSAYGWNLVLWPFMT